MISFILGITIYIIVLGGLLGASITLFILARKEKSKTKKCCGGSCGSKKC